MPQVTLTIPCFQEAGRLRPGELLRLAAAPGVRLMLVDDGSTDRTGELLAAIAERSRGRAEVLTLPHNRGKGEAVRRGLLRSLEEGAPAVGYADADLSTPVDELVRLARRLGEGPARVVMGARVQLLGTDIRRDPTRHYLGRVFATGASLALRLPVYDTQCGAKLLRATPELRGALASPFRTRWAFDVELMGRLLCAGYSAADFLEVPLRTWVDVKGSKLRPAAALHAFLDLVRIGVRVRRGG